MKALDPLHKLLCRFARHSVAPIYAAGRNTSLNDEYDTDNSWPFESEGGILSYI